MNRFCLILALVFPVYLTGQNYGGKVNNYYAVSSLAEYTNKVFCAGEDLGELHPGDKVLLIQMTGANFSRNLGWEKKKWEGEGEYNSVGHNEFLAVKSVDNSAKEVQFTANMKRSYNSGEKIQLVKILEADNINVESEIFPESWDSASGTGGVVAIVAMKKLVLNANIDASERGYSGAKPIDYTGVCLDSSDYYYKSDITTKGGRKGEGILTDTFSYSIGKGCAINGGGGGFGMDGGGGGGGNSMDGGRGGQQSFDCGTVDDISQGAVNLFPGFYQRWADTLGGKFYEKYCIVMGGGGGATAQSTGKLGSTGGNGGGIVVILADTIVGNGYNISANGQSATDSATSGGGGGGGAGSVILDARYISSTLTVNIKGGDGGDVSSTGPSTGSGGGGGGGVFWYNGAIEPNVSVNKDGGSFGEAQDPLHEGWEGKQGITLKNYEPVLNGFSFNAVSDNDTVCQGQAPKKLNGTQPKGKSPFTYQWYSSLDSLNWTEIDGAVDTNYQPETLLASTYFTRVVTNSLGERDTAFAVRVHVWDSIENYSVNVRDTICSGDSPGVLNADAPSGGNGTYTYMWESKVELGGWVQREDLGDQSQPIEVQLFETTYYRRNIVSGKVCMAQSNVDTITVHESIQNNSFISIDTTICNNLDAGVIVANTVTGGLLGDYRYSWLVSADDISYGSVPGDAESLLLGPLAQGKYYYKRVVYSGNDDACIDTTSTPRAVSVLPTLSNNIISSIETLYCSGDTQEILTGGVLSGGQAGDYRYTWQGNNGTGWQTIGGVATPNYQPSALTDTTLYRRIVVSGDDDACIDTSIGLSIDVIPEIINDLMSLGDTVCENSEPDVFAEGGAAGGSGAYTYLWLERQEGGGWAPASTATSANNNISYSPTKLVVTTYFRRMVTSQICSDTSGEIEVLVYPKIEDNLILGGAKQYVCYNSHADIDGSGYVVGGDNTYKYFWETSADDNSWGTAVGAANAEDYESGVLTTMAYYRRIVYSGEDDQCKDTTLSVQFLVNQLPQGNIENSIDTLCEGEQVSITYNVDGNGPWTISLGGDSELFSAEVDSKTGGFSFDLSKTSNIRILNLVDDSSCYADPNDLTGLVQAKVYEVPVANAGDDIEACGVTVNLNAIASVGKGKWTSDNATFTNDTLPDTEIKANDYGLANFTWTETNWRECVAQDDVSVLFYEQPTEVEAGENIELNYRFDATLDAEPETVGTGYWSFASGEGMFVDSTQSNTGVEVVGVGEYTLVWTIENGVCEAIQDSMQVIVSDLILYQGFSPNGDGINDLYEIDLSGGAQVELIIIDRNGNQVRRIDGRAGLIQWDGTNEKGKALPSDTYFYILNESGGESRTGYIELRR